MKKQCPLLQSVVFESTTGCRHIACAFCTDEGCAITFGCRMADETFHAVQELGEKLLKEKD